VISSVEFFSNIKILIESFKFSNFFLVIATVSSPLASCTKLTKANLASKSYEVSSAASHNPSCPG
jgi:hypothetical protein